MEGHRAGPFKQRNKAHKSGKKRSARDLTNGGRVRTTSVSSLRSLSSKGGSTVARSVRKNQLAQLRKLKREEILNARRGIAVAPVLVAVLNLADDGINESIFAQRLESFDSSSKCFTSKHGSYIHIEIPKFRASFQVVILNKMDLYGALDLAKIADILLLIHSTDTEAIFEAQQKDGQQIEALYLLEAIYNHCLPQTVHGIFNLNAVSNGKEKERFRKCILELIERQYPGTIDSGNTAKLRPLDSPQDLLQFFHYCSNVKRKPNSYCTRRSQLLAEEIKFEPDQNSQEEKGSMLVDGFIRNTAFNVNSLVYVPEFGEFQLETVEVITNPYQTRPKPSPFEGFRDDADLELRPSLDERENKVETLYEQEMADLGDGDNDQQNELALKSVITTKIEKRKLPKGTSDYQAAWIIDSDDEENEEEEEEDESENEDSEMLDVSTAVGTLKKGKSVQFAPVDQVFDDFESNANGQVGDESGADEDGVTNGDYDEEMNIEEDESSLAKFKEQRMYELFPDEIDTPAQVSARERFAKYRGLKSFRTSTWDPKENLPADYSRISQFQNFNRTKRRLFKTEPNGAEPGCYVRVKVIDVPRTMFEYYKNRDNKPLVLYQLLAHEHKMSVQNIVLKKVSSFSEPVQSKEELIFHLGCRRFAAKPIYSSHTVGDKHKYEKYLRADVACVATIYAPITFPPTPVLVYKQYADGQQVLVATGSLLDCSPDRLVIKRYILSGHPFKINRRHAVVRYMFFNREDILWFRPVELRTKSGRVGHILEPLGTHGHMKCVFDDQLTSQDTVLMCLYKRVFPKWSYRTEGISAPASLLAALDHVKDEEMTG